MAAAEHSIVTNLDLSFTIYVQNLFGSEMWTLWNLITNLGSPPFVMLVIGLTFWWGHPLLGLKLLIGVLCTAIIVDLLKVFFMQARPYYAFDEISGWRNTMGFGMPSGHAAGAATLWLMLINAIKKRWFACVAMTLILLIGVSRIYFGVHSPSQVLVGWVLGAVITFSLLHLANTKISNFLGKNTWLLIVAGIFSTAMLIGLQFLIMTQLAESFQTPVAWQTNFEEATRFETQLSNKTAASESLKLFDAFNLSQIGLIAGTWLLAALVKVSSIANPYQLSASCEYAKIDKATQTQSNKLQRVLTCVMGALVTLFCVWVLQFSNHHFVPDFILWTSIPSLITLFPLFIANTLVSFLQSRDDR